MVQAPPKPYLSPAEYLEIERAAETRSEYLDGEMLLRESGNRWHNLILGNLIGELGGQLKGRPGAVLLTGQRVRVLETRLYAYPDLLAVTGEARCEDECDDTLLNPSLIFEIFSPTTEAYDRGKKFYHYRKIPTLSRVCPRLPDRTSHRAVPPAGRAALALHPHGRTRALGLPHLDRLRVVSDGGLRQGGLRVKKHHALRLTRQKLQSIAGCRDAPTA